MTAKYKVDEAVRRTRLRALETALQHVRADYTERGDKITAAEELLGYRVFTTAQVAGWLGLTTYALEGRAQEFEDAGRAEGWGCRQLEVDQLPTAIQLAKAGLSESKPKTLIFDAHTKHGMTFDMIGGLLCQHKNTVRRIVRRIEGEPWT
ncbi:hypothetical protein [Leifsonia aquatica]|uniref:hypothetical protein n=1 Tax=Leifsonia aquatica TaxID=144185 RepID=UPI0004699F23|nr:hypothetical protein [Leifsonia aquatica]